MYLMPTIWHMFIIVLAMIRTTIALIAIHPLNSDEFHHHSIVTMNTDDYKIDLITTKEHVYAFLYFR